jgi:peptidoglycan/LPS O-acetylase OafA/YrhL
LHFGYLNGLLGHQWFQGVYWTLALEFQYYLLLCVAFPLLTARSQTTRFVSLAAGLLISLMFDVPRDNPPSLVFPFLSIFAAGALAFWKTTGKINNALFLAGLVLDGICVAKIHGTPSLVATLATALAIAYVRFHGPWLVTSLGQMSYSLYLVHQIIGHRIINLFSRFGDDAFVTSASRWFAIALSFLLAYVLYRTVESPSQRLSQQIRYRSRSPQNVAVT